MLRHVPPLRPDDTLGRALEMMRASGLHTLPVAENGTLKGVIRRQALHALLRQQGEQGRARPVADLLELEYHPLPSPYSVEDALDAAASAPDGVLIAVDSVGGYHGVVTHADLLSLWTNAVRPQRIAGMATPIGVYLTTGTLRAGVGNLGLALTGVLLAVFYLVSDYAAARITASLGTEWSLSLAGFTVREVLPLALMLLLIRWSPLAAYHAAEHQTVSAIEQGEALVPEVVSRMPRAHPRCGTNVVVILVVFAAVQWVDPYIALVTSLLAWRHLGRYLQQYITTRPASPKQLQKGLEAGQELLAKYREELVRAGGSSAIRRAWNLGWIQVLAGYAVTVAGYEFAKQWLTPG
ncbi:MAG: DUF1385 domain-containing protein [Armatimonadota bacterium]